MKVIIQVISRVPKKSFSSLKTSSDYLDHNDLVSAEHVTRNTVPCNYELKKKFQIGLYLSLQLNSNL